MARIISRLSAKLCFTWCGIFMVTYVVHRRLSAAPDSRVVNPRAVDTGGSVAHVLAAVHPSTDKSRLLIPPSGEAAVYSFGTADRMTPQAQAVIDILHRKRNGVFVEAGAYDGETASNSAYLENELGWTGLLVEMNPMYFTQIIGKNRNSYSIQACLSSTNSPKMVDFWSFGQGSNIRGVKRDSHEKIMKLQAPCFPLAAILQTINITKIDYLSLDVEGEELYVLHTIPKYLDISIISVEYLHGRHSPNTTLAYMERQGYTLYKDIQHRDTVQHVFVWDYIFVKNGLKL